MVSVIRRERSSPTSREDVPFICLIGGSGDMWTGQRCSERCTHLHSRPNIITPLGIQRSTGPFRPDRRNFGIRKRGFIRFEGRRFRTGGSGIGICLCTFRGEEAERSASGGRRFSGIGISSGSLFAYTSVMFSLFSGHLTEFSGEGVICCGGRGSTSLCADDTCRLGSAGG